MMDYPIKRDTNTANITSLLQTTSQTHHHTTIPEMNFVWLVGLVCLTAVAGQSQNDLMLATPKRFEPHRKFCGRILADTLSLVCAGKYNEFRSGKRSGLPHGEGQSDDYVYDQPQYYQEEEFPWPFLSRQVAAALLPSPYHRRQRRGVIEECCQKPCAFSELQSYCAS